MQNYICTQQIHETNLGGTNRGQVAHAGHTSPAVNERTVRTARHSQAIGFKEEVLLHWCWHIVRASSPETDRVTCHIVLISSM